MPTYEYVCESCGHEMEVFQLMSASPMVDCPACEATSLKRKIGMGAGIIFKGSGFYETDFKDKKGKKESDAPAKKEDSSNSTDSTPKEKEKQSTDKAKPEKKPISPEKGEIC